MTNPRHGRSVLQRLIAGALLIGALILGVQCVSAVTHQDGLLVYGLDKDIGTIKLGDRFDRSIVVCNLTLQPVNVTVVQACSCSSASSVHRRISPYTVGFIHLPYHIVVQDKGSTTTRAIFKCAFPGGKEVYYMAASTYTVK